LTRFFDRLILSLFGFVKKEADGSEHRGIALQQEFPQGGEELRISFLYISAERKKV